MATARVHTRPFFPLLLLFILVIVSVVGSGCIDRLFPAGPDDGSASSQPITVRIAAPAADAIITGTVEISGSASENTMLVQLRIGAGDWQSCVGTTTWDFLLDTTPYPAGLLQVRVRAFDGGRYSSIDSRTFTVEHPLDNQPPTVRISSPSSDDTVSGVITVSGRAIDPDGDHLALDYSLDTTAWRSITNWQAGTGSWSFQWDTTEVADGSRSLTIRATETVGDSNAMDQTAVRSAFATVRVVVDNRIVVENQAPTCAINEPLPGATVSGSVTIRGTASDPDGDAVAVVIRIDDGGWQAVSGSTSWSYTWPTTSVQDGTHTLAVRADDGTVRSPLVQTTVTVHNTAENQPPSCWITAPEAGATVNGAVLVRGIASDPEDELQSVEVRIDANDWHRVSGTTSWSVEWDTTALADGAHTLAARAFDGALYSPLVERDLVVANGGGNTAPIVIVQTPSDAAVCIDLVEITGHASDPDGALASVEVQCQPGADPNATAPVAAAWQPVTGLEEWVYYWDTHSVQNGPYLIYARASDGALYSSPAVVRVTVDNPPRNHPPLCQIQSPTNQTPLDGTVVVTGTASDPDGTFETVELSILAVGASTTEERVWEPVIGTANWEYYWDTTMSVDGPYSLAARAYDGEYYSSLAELVVEVENTIENHAPWCTIQSPLANATVTDTIVFSGRAGDEDSDVISGPGGQVERVEIRLAGAGNWTTAAGTTRWSWEWDTTTVPNGSYTIHARSWDGVVYSTPVSSRVWVANRVNQPPQLAILAPVNGTEVRFDTVINGTATDPDGSVASVWVRIGNGSWTAANGADPWTMPFPTEQWPNGSIDLSAKAFDNEGLVSALVTVTVIIANPPPILPFAVTNVDRLILPETGYAGVVVAAPLVASAGVSCAVNWSSHTSGVGSGYGVELSVGFSSLSLFSSRLAVSYWSAAASNPNGLMVPSHAVVTDSYAHALQLAPLAALLDAPLLINGTSTSQCLHTLGVGDSQVIAYNVDAYSSNAGVVLTESTVYSYIISTAQTLAQPIEYLVVTNPDDTPDASSTAHLSAFAAPLAVYRQGLVLTVAADTAVIDYTVETIAGDLESVGWTPRYLALVGDSFSVPFVYESIGGEFAPSDNEYADLDNNISTLELATGRLIALELWDMSAQLDRILNYDTYLDTTSAPLAPRPTLGLDWNNNAVIYMGYLAEFAHDSEIATRELLYTDGFFNTKDDTAAAHEMPPNTYQIVNDFAQSNFIAINADHGAPTGTTTFSSDDLIDMHPGVCFGVSCSLGRIDGVPKETAVTYALLEHGLAVYLGSTRTTYGEWGGSGLFYDPDVAPGLCYYFFEALITNDLTTGEALQQAKNDLIAYGDPSTTNRLVVWEYVHYGDPAFDPYEPANEGRLPSTTSVTAATTTTTTTTTRTTAAATTTVTSKATTATTTTRRAPGTVRTTTLAAQRTVHDLAFHETAAKMVPLIPNDRGRTENGPILSAGAHPGSHLLVRIPPALRSRIRSAFDTSFATASSTVPTIHDGEVSVGSRYVFCGHFSELFYAGIT